MLEQQVKDLKNPSTSKTSEITLTTIENLLEPLYDKISVLEETISRLQDKPLNAMLPDSDSLKKLAGQVSDLAVTVATLIEWKNDIEAERSRSL